MIDYLHVAIALLSVLVVVSAYGLLWSVRHGWARWLMVATLLLFPALMASASLQSSGKPIKARFYTALYGDGEVEIVGAAILHQEAIAIAVLGKNGPSLIEVPYDQKLAEQLEAAQRKAKVERAPLFVRLSDLARKNRKDRAGGEPSGGEGQGRGGSGAGNTTGESDTEAERNPFFVPPPSTFLPEKG